jgi:hypothetical protein
MISESAHVLSSRWVRLVLAAVFLKAVCPYGAFGGLPVTLFGFGGLLFATGATVLVRRLGENRPCSLGRRYCCCRSAVHRRSAYVGLGDSRMFLHRAGLLHAACILQINATQMAPERCGATVSAFAPRFFPGQSLGIDLTGIVADHMGTATVLVLGSAGLLLISLDFSRL